MKTIFCVGLIQVNGFKFITKVKLEIELSDGKTYKLI